MGVYKTPAIDLGINSRWAMRNIQFSSQVGKLAFLFSWHHFFHITLEKLICGANLQKIISEGEIMDMLDEIAIDLSEGARKNFEEYGQIAPMVFFVINDTLNPLPKQLIDLMHADRDKFRDVVSELVKEHNPLAVAIISEAWYLDLQKGDKLEVPSQSKEKKECVFVTVDSSEKQISYYAEIKDKKLGEWIRQPVYFKKGGEVKTSGNIIDFYGTGTALNVPLEMHKTPRGDSKVSKID